MDTIGPWELLIIVVVLVALCGANRLPKMARGPGEGIREFKKGIAEAGHDSATDEPTSPDGPAASGQAESWPASAMPFLNSRLRTDGWMVMFNVGIGEIAVIVLVCLVVFGHSGCRRRPARRAAGWRRPACWCNVPWTSSRPRPT